MKEKASGRKRGRPRSGERRIVSFRADADVAEFLVGKAAVHKDDDGEDFYRVALRIAGRNACVRTKLEYGYPLNGEDISFLKSLL